MFRQLLVVLRFRKYALLHIIIDINGRNALSSELAFSRGLLCVCVG